MGALILIIPLVLAPFGILIGLVVLFVSVVNASLPLNESHETSTGETNLAENMGEKGDMAADANSASEVKPPRRHARWNITRDQIRTILRLNIIASVVVIAATVVNVYATLTNAPSYYWLAHPRMVAALQAIPVLIVGWLMWLAWQAWKANGTPEVNSRFARLERVQRVVGIESVVWLVFMALGSGLEGTFRNGFFAAAAFTLPLTGIVAMVITVRVRGKIELAATDMGGNTGGR